VKIRAYIFVVVVLVLFAGPQARADSISAQQQDPNKHKDLFEMSIEELMDVPVVFSAARQPQKIGQLSVPVSVITDEDIHYSGLTNIPEILQFVPGVDVLRCDRNHYALGVRGLHEVWSDRTLALIDGRNLNSPLFGGADWQLLPLLMEDIKRIEVVRGPGGAAWGANAFNGVINIITKEPEDCLGYTSSTTWSHFGDNYNYFRYADKSGPWSWRTSVGYEDRKSSHDAVSADYEMDKPDLEWLFPSPFSTFEVRDFARNWRFDNKMIYRSSDQTKWSLGAAAGHFEEGDFEMLGYFPQKDERHDTSRVFVRVDHDFGQDTQGYLQWFNNYNNSYRPSLLKYTDMENDIEGQLNFKMGSHKFSAGGNMRLIRIDGKVTDPNDFVIDGEPLDEDWVGLFAIDHWQVTDRLAFEGQYRWDKYSETQSDWSTRLSAMYALDKDNRHIIRLSGAKAYRAPLASLRRFRLQRLQIPEYGIYAVNMNPNDLINEEIWSLEAGYTGQFAKGISLRVDSYYQRYNDLIGYHDTPNPWGVIITQADNGEGADALGGEVELAWNQKWGKLSVWHAYNDLDTDRSYEELRAYHPAKHKTGLTARAFLASDVELNANYRFTSRTNFSSDETVKPTTVESTHRLDLSVSKTFADKRGELTVGVADVFNQTEVKAIALARLCNHDTPGRMFFARMQLKF
jgi:outer membrane cobalamin receptor